MRYFRSFTTRIESEDLDGSCKFYKLIHDNFFKSRLFVPVLYQGLNELTLHIKTNKNNILYENEKMNKIKMKVTLPYALARLL